MFSTLAIFLFFAVFSYVAYKIIRYSAFQMRTQAILNRFVTKSRTANGGSTQPIYDLNHSMTSEARTREIRFLENLFDSEKPLFQKIREARSAAAGATRGGQPPEEEPYLLS